MDEPPGSHARLPEELPDPTAPPSRGWGRPPLRRVLDAVLAKDAVWAAGSILLLGAIEVGRPRPGDLEPAAIAGTALLAAVLVSLLYRYAREAQQAHERVRRLFPFLCLILVLQAALARAGFVLAGAARWALSAPFDRPEILAYLVPAASGAVLVALLANPRIATAYAIFSTAAVAIFSAWNPGWVVFLLITQLAGVHGLTHYRTRGAVLRAGLVVGATGAAVAAGLDAVVHGFSPVGPALAAVAAAFLGGAVGVPLVVAFLLPILEWVFGILTDIRLLELSNLNNPLLAELALRAPGSYNHSIVVGTLAEAAAEAIGANALFCRVAAFYHDLGKLKMPHYYIENQKPGQNPHDRLDPAMSALILSSHVHEGIRLGRAHGLPEPILEIIPQHHGTRVMTYFYEKAKAAASAAGLPPPTPDAFRHPGPKPASREAAIFMLADSVEAAARTIGEPDDETFRGMIRQITSRVILDGQFEHCDLTFMELEKITEAFVRALGSIYHRRIDYPTFIFDEAARTRTDRQR